MPNLLTLSAQFRAALLKRDKVASKKIANAYGVAYKQIKKREDKLLLAIATARESGQVVSQSWLFQQRRYAELLNQIEKEISKFSKVASGIITDAQADVVNKAISDAPKLLQSAFSPIPVDIEFMFNRIPKAAVESFIGTLSDGSALSDLLGELGPAARQSVQQSLLTGIVAGDGVAKIARNIRQSLGRNLTRALTISRTEVLRSYRVASLAAYRANANLTRGWVWMCALGPRSCAACFAMHGSEHTLNESLDDHVNGRCSMLPITRSYAELGIEGVDEPTLRIESGEVAFGRLSAEQQRAILGKAGYEAYRDGRATLGDFVGVHNDRRWGSMVYQKPISRVAA